ncbi:MAG: hypothetical protein AABY93_18505 [Bacteroidota bacterium]
MKKTVLIIGILAMGLPLFSQKKKGTSVATPMEIKIPMTAARWDFPANSVEFSEYKGSPAMKIISGGDKAILKDLQFTNGTIEYDIEPQSDGFAGTNFRMVDNNESEYFYMRVSRAGNPVAMDAVQYAPIIKGVNLWDMLDHYQGPANMKKNEWNHVKLVVSGKQMIVYVNDMDRTTLEIPRLEGNTTSGSIAFNGKCAIANLVIKPDAVEGLSAREGFDPTHHDSRYIRVWQVSEPQPLPKGKELYDGEFPKSETKWQNIEVERRGLVNLTRLHGLSERRFVWLRVKLISNKEQKRKMSLGFSDEVWVYVNHQPVFVDKNIYPSPGMRKTPDGRISIENSELEVPLKAGDNELLIGVANDFFGWGIIARLDNMDGIEASINFPPPAVQPKDLSPYLGSYTSEDKSEKIIFTTAENKLMGQASGQQAVALEYFDKDKFRLEQAGVVLEFYPTDKKMILKQGTRVTTFLRE